MAAAQRFHFTQARVRDLPAAPPGRRVVYYHNAPNELALRVTATGAKTFYLVKRFGPRVEFLRIGRFPSVGVGDAETRAKELLGEAAKGGNPAADARQGAVTVREFLAKFLDEYAAANCSAGTLTNWRILTRRHIVRATKAGAAHEDAWRQAGASANGDVRLDAITAEWVARLQRTIAPRPNSPRRRTANAAVVLLRRAFKVAADGWGWKLPHGNPAAGVPLFADAEKDAARTRHLTTDELGRLFDALRGETPEARLVVLIALLTGQRRGNVLSARWDAIDLEAGTWLIRHAPRLGTTTKNRRDALVVVPHALIAPLRAWRDRLPEGVPWVFPSPTGDGHLIDFKKPWRRICDAAALEDFRFHDLRHSCATLMLAAGAPLPVIGRQLGHRSAESTARYAHVQLDGQRAAMAAVAGALPTLPTKPKRKGAR